MIFYGIWVFISVLIFFVFYGKISWYQQLTGFMVAEYWNGGIVELWVLIGIRSFKFKN